MKHSFTSIKSILCKAALSCSLALVFAAGSKAYGTLDQDLATLDAMYPKTLSSLSVIPAITDVRGMVNGFVADEGMGMGKGMTDAEFATAVLDGQPAQTSQFHTLRSFENVMGFQDGPLGTMFSTFSPRAMAHFCILAALFDGEHIDFNFAWQNYVYPDLERACLQEEIADSIQIVKGMRHQLYRQNP